jgi:predicted house-cleaning noncanonical NTP pyrophosphatase (MazG superfamily)
MKAINLLILSSLLIIACGEKKEQSATKSAEEEQADLREELYNDVMAVHDEVMPRMDEIYKLKNKLQDELKELLESKSEDNAARISSLTEKINALEDAGKGMMVWMRQFDVLPDSLGHEAIMQGLADEMKKIEKVKSDMLEAIERAKE